MLTGSHLDSVHDGGAYDGPLGVVSALAALEALRERDAAPGRPIGVAVFVEEEGSRFGRACLGSRLATGVTTWTEARGLTDRDGVALEEAMSDVPTGGTDLLADVGCFVELHVEQGRDLVDRGAPVGVASAIRPHGRYRFDFRGAADHAGTTRMEDRRDPMLTYAMSVLATNKQARVTGGRATFGRVEAHPNGTHAVPRGSRPGSTSAPTPRNTSTTCSRRSSGWPASVRRGTAPPCTSSPSPSRCPARSASTRA